MSDRPVKLEIGQRWKDMSGAVITVDREASEYSDHRKAFWLKHDDGSSDSWCHDDYVPRNRDYYVYLGSGTSSPVPAAQECTCGGACGGESHECGICGKHCPGKPEPLPPKAHRPPQSLSWDERRDSAGVAMSALEAIRARPKPEPWVESCDPLHWIPDV